MKKKRSRKIPAIPAIMVLSLALAAVACMQGEAQSGKTAQEDQEESGPAASVVRLRETATPVPLLTYDRNAGEEAEDEILAEAKLDIDGDGAKERLVVRMTRGTKREETEPGAFMGTIRKGDVRLEWIDAEGNLLHARDLNPDFGGIPLLFEERRDFTLRLDDYNSDGNPELALGQYVSSNAFVHNLYEMSDDGFRLLLAGLVSSHTGYSIRFERIGSQAFKNRFYNMEEGVYDEQVYVWLDGRYVRAADPDLDCEGCRRWDSDWTGLAYIPTEDGFVLAADEPVYSRTFHLSPPIAGKSYIVQELFLERHDATDGEWIRNAALAIDPATGDVNLIPLYRAETGNLFQTSSIAYGQGFLPDGKWVFVSAANDSGAEARYQISQMDPVSGETSILVPELPVSKEDRFPVSWMTADGKTFVIIGNETGVMRVMDLPGGEWTVMEERFSNTWPFPKIYRSPDGERFWHHDPDKDEFRYYDLAGNVLAAFPAADMDNDPAISWSHDGRYAVYSSTFDRDGKHILRYGGGITDAVATQRLAFHDREGTLVRTVETTEDGTHVELAGWPAPGGDVVLIERYRLADHPEARHTRIKTDRRHRLLDLNTGKETALQPAAVPEPGQISDVFIGPSHGPVGLVDRESGQLTLLDNSVQRVRTDDATLAWTWTDTEARTSRLYLWHPEFPRLTVYDIPMIFTDSVVVGGEWWYTGGMAAHHLPTMAGNP